MLKESSTRPFTLLAAYQAARSQEYILTARSAALTDRSTAIAAERAAEEQGMIAAGLETSISCANPCDLKDVYALLAIVRDGLGPVYEANSGDCDLRDYSRALNKAFQWVKTHALFDADQQQSQYDQATKTNPAEEAS